MCHSPQSFPINPSTLHYTLLTLLTVPNAPRVPKADAMSAAARRILATASCCSQSLSWSAGEVVGTVKDDNQCVTRKESSAGSGPLAAVAIAEDCTGIAAAVIVGTASCCALGSLLPVRSTGGGLLVDMCCELWIEPSLCLSQLSLEDQFSCFTRTSFLLAIGCAAGFCSRVRLAMACNTKADVGSSSTRLVRCFLSRCAGRAVMVADLRVRPRNG
jgi:hypothetical protein